MNKERRYAELLKLFDVRSPSRMAQIEIRITQDMDIDELRRYALLAAQNLNYVRKHLAKEIVEREADEIALREICNLWNDIMKDFDARK